MNCPFCSKPDNHVVDSRDVRDGAEIRRRRECDDCGRRFTTYERLEELVPVSVSYRTGELGQGFSTGLRLSQLESDGYRERAGSEQWAVFWSGRWRGRAGYLTRRLPGVQLAPLADGRGPRRRGGRARVMWGSGRRRDGGSPAAIRARPPHSPIRAAVARFRSKPAVIASIRAASRPPPALANSR